MNPNYINSSSNPVNTLNVNDPGDDTQRRYRYQAFFAALISLELLLPDSEFAEIFCEHHDDTLVRRKDGKFISIQVKTRIHGRDPLKADEDQILNSLCRFVEQELEFPGYFVRFIIATNYAFWNAEKRNSRNLYYLIELAQEACSTNNHRLHRGLSRCINDIIDKVNRRARKIVDKDTVLKVLACVEPQEDLPKFDDIESRLAKHILDYYKGLNEAGFDDLLQAARDLISRMFEAGSLQYVSAQQMYFSLFSNPSQVKTNTVIEGKRITKLAVEKVLQKSLHSRPLLVSRNRVLISDLPHDMSTLKLKMAAGKVSAINIQRTEDHVYSAYVLLDRWIHKYGSEKANARFQQLKIIVGNECQEAHDREFSHDIPFGQKMLKEVRQRLKQRKDGEPELFFECTHEHVLGIAGILTELCDIWWSEEFNIPTNILP